MSIKDRKPNRKASKLHENAVKAPVKRPFTIELVDKKTPLKSSFLRIGENLHTRPTIPNYHRPTKEIRHGEF